MTKKKTKNKSIVPIVYCLDKKFVDYTKLSIDSLLHDNPNAVIELIVPEYIEELSQYKQHICSNETLKNVYIREYDRISAFTYARLYIPELLKEYDKCIYIDGDIIVRRNLDDVMNMDIPYIGAVKDADAKWLLKEIDKPVYYNAGFLVLNLKQLRKDNFTSKCIDYIDNHNKNYLGRDESWLHDQTTINALYSEKITELDESYNWQLSWNPPSKYSEIKNDPTNIHCLTDYNKSTFVRYCYERYKEFPSINTGVDIVLIIENETAPYYIDDTIKSVLNQIYENVKLHIFCMSRNRILDSYFKELESNKIVLNDATYVTNKNYIYTYLQNEYNKFISNNLLIINEHTILRNTAILSMLISLTRYKQNFICGKTMKIGDAGTELLSISDPEYGKPEMLFYIPYIEASYLSRLNDFKSFDFTKCGIYPEAEYLNYLVSKYIDIKYSYGVFANVTEWTRVVDKFKFFRTPDELTFMIKRSFANLGYELNFNEARYLNHYYTNETILNASEKLHIRQIRKDIELKYNKIINMDICYKRFKV